MKAVLYNIGKSAMQSGLIRENLWVLKFIPTEKIYHQYQQTHWDGTSSTIKQQTMTFDSAKSAIDYCHKHNIVHHNISTHKKTLRVKSYTDTINKI